MEVTDQAHEQYSKSNRAGPALQHAMAVRLCDHKSLNMTVSAHKRGRNGGLIDSLRTFSRCQVLYGYGEGS